jgi:hypothetical protein
MGATEGTEGVDSASRGGMNYGIEWVGFEASGEGFLL